MWKPSNKAPGAIKYMITPDPDLQENCCESNCKTYVAKFGGTIIEGVLVFEHVSLSLIQVVRHFVVRDRHGDIVDPTPSTHINGWFVVDVQLGRPNAIDRSYELAIAPVRSNQKWYYVYHYVDPRTNRPFYVGKGTSNRAYVHLRASQRKYEKHKKRFFNKLTSMKRQNIEPIILFVAQNITDEEVAYEIEQQEIQQYGRKGYDRNGILLNITTDSRPPNHRGKTYPQIYGDKWQAQLENRRKLQLARGGYGPKRHSAETKSKIQTHSAGLSNGRCCQITEEQLLVYGQQYCSMHPQIGYTSWRKFCSETGIPTLFRSFRFNRRFLLEVFADKFGVKYQTRRKDSSYELDRYLKSQP